MLCDPSVLPKSESLAAAVLVGQESWEAGLRLHAFQVLGVSGFWAHGLEFKFQGFGVLGLWFRV